MKKITLLLLFASLSIKAQSITLYFSSCLPVVPIKKLTPVGGFDMMIEGDFKISDHFGLKAAL